MNKSTKKVKWVGDSRVQVRNFPKAARTRALRSLKWEVKTKTQNHYGEWVLVYLRSLLVITNTYRAVYTVKLGENIYVLQIPGKSTRGIRTPKDEIDD